MMGRMAGSSCKPDRQYLFFKCFFFIIIDVKIVSHNVLNASNKTKCLVLIMVGTSLRVLNEFTLLEEVLLLGVLLI